MFSGSAYIVDELDTTTRSFLEKNLHLRDTYFDYHLCLKLVDNYVRSFERISESYSDLCSDLKKLSAAVVNGDDGGLEALSEFAARNNGVFANLAYGVREITYRPLVAELGKLIEEYFHAGIQKPPYVADLLPRDYLYLTQDGAGCLDYVSRAEQLDAHLGRIVAEAIGSYS